MEFTGFVQLETSQLERRVTRISKKKTIVKVIAPLNAPAVTETPRSTSTDPG